MTESTQVARDLPGAQTPHHYELAHVALRHIAQADPEWFFKVMKSSNRRRFLDDVWRQVCANCDDEGPATFGAANLKVSSKRLGTHAVILIEMPLAMFMTEAHMVCVALAVPARGMTAGAEPPEMRYFTLENGSLSEDDAGSTKLCEWREEQHRNYGPGPTVSAQALLERVKTLLSREAG